MLKNISENVIIFFFFQYVKTLFLKDIDSFEETEGKTNSINFLAL